MTTKADTDTKASGGLKAPRKYADWQLDPTTLTTPRVQLWSQSGTMAGVISSETATAKVRCGTHFVISIQAIGEKPPQAQSSPLPQSEINAIVKQCSDEAYLESWKVRANQAEQEADLMRAHAQALADALRDIKRETGESRDFRSAAMCASIAHKALAAWEGAQ